jgi:cytochrome c-type biogenesis protein CcmH/NrfG
VSRESLIFGVAGLFLGVLIGWIVGSQQGSSPRQAAAAAPAAQQPRAPAQNQQQTAAPLDEARVASLRQTAERDPRDARVRAELGNAYFDAERFQDASRWYEEALKLDPRNVSMSTDLGISYYYMNQPDRALAQFDQSLAIDPRHSKTLLNIGIVRAYAKDDLEGAVKVWQRVVELAPESAEGKVARQALDAVRSSHPNAAPPAKAPGSE